MIHVRAEWGEVFGAALAYVSRLIENDAPLPGADTPASVLVVDRFIVLVVHIFISD